MADTLYDAFISYRHDAHQAAVAQALQRALERFAKPWWRIRALRLFRDSTNLGARPDLWSTITQALDQSRFLILFASPESARSEWVAREIEYWIERRSTDNLLFVLTGGQLRFDNAQARFDAAVTDALPSRLLAKFEREPLYVDLSWVRNPGLDLAETNPRFADAVASLAATLHNRPKDEISGENVRQHRRTRRIATVAAAAIGVLGLAATGASIAYYFEAERAEQQRRLAVGRFLSATAGQLGDQLVDKRGSPEAKGLRERIATVTVEALLRLPAFEAGALTASVIAALNEPVAEDGANHLLFLPGSRNLAAVSSDDGVLLRDIDQQTMVQIPRARLGLAEKSGPSLHFATPTPDGRFLAVLSSADDYLVVDTLKQDRVATLRASALSVSTSRDSRWLSVLSRRSQAKDPGGVIVLDLPSGPSKEYALGLLKPADPALFDNSGRLFLHDGKCLARLSLADGSVSPLLRTTGDLWITSAEIADTGRRLALIIRPNEYATGPALPPDAPVLPLDETAGAPPCEAPEISQAGVYLLSPDGGEAQQLVADEKPLRTRFSGDGERLVVATLKQLRVIDLRRGEDLGKVEFDGETTREISLSISASGRWVGAASHAGVTVLGDLQLNRWQRFDVQGPNPVELAGERWALVSDQTALRIFDLEEWGPIAYHPGELSQATMSHDGKLLAVRVDGAAVVTRLDPTELRSWLCAGPGANFERQDWTRYMGSEPWRPTCPGWK